MAPPRLVIRWLPLSAVVRCGWLPWLAAVVVATGFSSGARADAGPIFHEEARELGVEFFHMNGASGEYYFPEINGAGVGWLDYDGDGDLDLYLNQGAMMGEGETLADAIFPPPPGNPECDALYRNDLHREPDGSIQIRFVDVTRKSGLAACGFGTGVAAGDLDNDGWVDLYISNFGPNQLWHNRGDGTFEEIVARSGTDDSRWSVPAAFFDQDGDGWLDLFVGNYADFRVTNHKECFTQAGLRDYCGPKSYRTEPDRFFRNRGDGTFEDVTLKAGMGEEYGYALGAIPADLDGDGWLDLYVANDGVENQLWLNQHDGTFSNEALLAGCAVNAEGMPESSMGVDVGDFDNDGDLDLFMTHIVNETNTIFVNDGNAIFEDRSRPMGLGMQSWKYTGFGTAFFDYDNDGWLDLLVVTGAVTVIDELLEQGDPFPFHQPNQLFHNLAGSRFEETTAQAGPGFNASETSRGAAFGDLDNDGDPDVLVHNTAGMTRIFVNQVGQEQHWLGFRLLGTAGRRNLIGATVTLEREGRPHLFRAVRIAGSYASSNDPRVVLGLGEAAETGPIEIRWPDGGRTKLRGLPIDTYVEVVRSTETDARAVGPPTGERP